PDTSKPTNKRTDSAEHAEELSSVSREQPVAGCST
uniref:Uncharacterized protein n=1 Tax=Ciona intestinalis TaxID=7719 RepID=H2XJN7_CIOIN